jgi:hypothetical protein
MCTIRREEYMLARVLFRFGAGVLLALAAAPAQAADKAVGTFTVDGKTIRFAEVYATLERDPADTGRKYLMLLVADVPVVPADRVPERLLATPLVGAVQSCSLDAVDALIAAGSDLSAKSAGGMTALQLADTFQRTDIAAALRKAGAK